MHFSTSMVAYLAGDPDTARSEAQQALTSARQLRAGVRTEIFSRWLGHHSSHFTADVYQHEVPLLMEEAGERVTALILRGEHSVDKALTTERGSGPTRRESAGQVAGGAGLEPATSGSKVRRSAN